MEKENKESKKLWSKGVIALIIFAFLLIVFSFIAPIIFTQPSGKVVFGNDTGVIGDTIGGIMNPFIALAGVIVTGLAFYMQLRANQIQISNFKKELDAQKDQNKLSQFESQFYEMLRLHKENVNEIEVEVTEIRQDSNPFGGGSETKNILKKQIKGRDTFIFFSNELEISYKAYLESIGENSPLFNFSIPYKGFFNGIDTIDSHTAFFNSLNTAKKANMFKYLDDDSEQIISITKVFEKHVLFEGHENKLGHYYRHLFHTVKFIAHQDESFIPYHEKRKYLRLLRAQLSNYEQSMLFYNSLAYAPEWERGNKFFSDYRMIHNLGEETLIQDKYFLAEYDKLKSKQEEVRTYKDNDHIFDSQRWDY
jgi:hypothetical protein